MRCVIIPNDHRKVEAICLVVIRATSLHLSEKSVNIIHTYIIKNGIVAIREWYFFYLFYQCCVQGNMLDNPITTKDSHLLELNGIVAGATGMQGWRLEMEVCRRLKFLYFV